MLLIATLCFSSGLPLRFAVDPSNVTVTAGSGQIGTALEDINFSLYPGLCKSSAYLGVGIISS